MQNNKEEMDSDLTSKYIAVMNTISEMEKRLGFADLVFLSLNILLILFTVNYVSSILQKMAITLSPYELMLTLICLVVGMAVCVYWAASAIRIQLKLKLRYFQARYMERRMNYIGEYLFSDEAVFFDPAIRCLKSPDQQETLLYPTEGFTRMDGFIGSAKPRYFSWFMPLLFFMMYWLIFLWVVVKSF